MTEAQAGNDEVLELIYMYGAYYDGDMNAMQLKEALGACRSGNKDDLGRFLIRMSKEKKNTE